MARQNLTKSGIAITAKIIIPFDAEFKATSNGTKMNGSLIEKKKAFLLLVRKTHVCPQGTNVCQIFSFHLARKVGKVAKVS